MARPGDDVDDDAESLRWAGDEEQGRAAPRLRGPDAGSSVATRPDPVAAPGARGRAVAAVVFAVPYLAFTVGWIFAVQQLPSGSGSLFGEVLWQFGEFLAMLAAPLWFVATLTLTRPCRPLVRVGWLALGLVVVAPWPLVLRFLAALELAGVIS